MLIELPKEKYSLLYGIKEFDLFPLISSVVYQKQTGKIFVDNIDEPQVVYIVHKSAFSYLYSVKKIGYDAFLQFLYNNEYTPEYSHIYNAPDELVAMAEKAAIVNVKIRKKMRMRGAPDMAGIPEPGSGRFTAKSVDKVDISQLAKFNLNFIEKFWDSVEDFIKNGFGWVIFDDGDPACVWYTVALINNNCESDLLTLPEHRGKGLASIAAVYMLRTCAERKVNMDWDVLTDNTPSIKIAERYGYTPYFVYNFLSIFKNQ